MCETIVPNLGGILDVDGQISRRIRCSNHAMAPTKRTAVVPQAPGPGIDICAIDDSESATMASAPIFPHLTFLPIDRTLVHWVSPDATAVQHRMAPAPHLRLGASRVSHPSALVP